MPESIREGESIHTCLMWVINLCIDAYSVKSMQLFLSSSNTWTNFDATSLPIGLPSKVTEREVRDEVKRW